MNESYYNTEGAMLGYNTGREPLRLPEYGRYIQEMVEFCKSLPDKDERTRCATTIVAAMARMHPEVRGNAEARQKLWDHLAVLADYDLDIDWPMEPAGREEQSSAPMAMHYDTSFIRHRNYGACIERLIDQACVMEDDEARYELSILIANQMKKALTVTRLDHIEDGRVMADLEYMSRGMLRLNPEEVRLVDTTAMVPPTQSNNRRRRRR